MLFSVAGCVRWSLPSRQLVRLNLVSLSFPTSDPPLSVGRTLSSSSSSALVSQNTVGVFCSSVY